MPERKPHAFVRRIIVADNEATTQSATATPYPGRVPGAPLHPAGLAQRPSQRVERDLRLHVHP